MAKSVNSLPLELKVNILSRLSHKELHDCRRVSKHWLAVINTQEFLLAYRYRHSLEDPPEGSSIIINVADSSSVVFVNFEGAYDTTCYTQRTDQSHPKPLDFPSLIIGSCNGVVCFECYLSKDDLSRDRLREQGVIGQGTQTRQRQQQQPGVTNPYKTRVHKYLISISATGAYKVLPDLVTKYDLESLEHLSGFGYDSVGDDYKVLRIDELRDKEAPKEQKYKCECYMYSLKANSWEKIDTAYVNPCSTSASASWANVVPLHSALHWFPQNLDCHDHTRCNNINGFHLGTKEFFEIALPDGFEKGGKPSLVTVKGCLHLTRIVFGSVDSELCLWIMKEYGVKESWIMSFSYSSITYNFIGYKFWWSSPRFSIFAYSGDGNELIFGTRIGDRIVRVNLQTREAKLVDLSPIKCGRVMPWTTSSYPLFITH